MNLQEEIENLGALLKSTEDEETASSLFRGFCKSNRIRGEELKVSLMTCNCQICDECGLFFGDSEISKDDCLICVYCGEE